MTKTFRNTNWTRRISDATNIVFCIAEKAPAPHWVETVETIPANMDRLYTQAGATFFGFQ